MSPRIYFPPPLAQTLQPHLPPQQNPHPTRPWVTLTYATSLDSQLSLSPGIRTALSGPLSKAMTHHLRSLHSGILIGANTAIADDPGLNCRVSAIPPGPETPSPSPPVPSPAKITPPNPRPIILDPTLRWDITPNTKVLTLASEGKGLAPWILTSIPRCQIPVAKKVLLEAHGGKYIHVPSETPRQFSWGSILDALHSQGISSVMVEGGAAVINSLLQTGRQHYVDSVIVTLAPVWLGKGGVVVCPERPEGDEAPGAVARLKEVKWVPMGEDMVVCGQLRDS